MNSFQAHDNEDSVTAESPAKTDDLTRFQVDVLAAIRRLEASGESRYELPHGLAIKYLLEDRYQTEQVHHSRLYPNLHTLEAEGLVDRVEIDKRTTGYSLTHDGETLLAERADWLLGGDW